MENEELGNIINWHKKEKGLQEAVGEGSQMTLKHEVSGEGDQEKHEITLEDGNAPSFKVEKTEKGIKITTIGEWEFTEFKEFVEKI